MAPLLQVKNLGVEFATRQGHLRALDDVSFDIHAGEIVGMVGESGAGKSLTGAALIGLVEPPGRVCAGDIFFDGQRIAARDGAAQQRLRGRHIGAVFQDPLTALDPLYTIGRQLTETLRTHLPLSAAQAEERAIELLEQVGIPGAAQRLSQYPHQFSGGMRQRVAIALALAPQPRLIVADEPTTALDVSLQAQIIALLKRLCREQGTAILLITHDMGVVAEACDRVVVLYAGRVAETGPVRNVLLQPAHPYTAGLMAALPSLDADRERLQPITGVMPRPGAVPAGCAFHPRCPHAFARCQAERPPLLAAGGSRAACWLHADDQRHPA